VASHERNISNKKMLRIPECKITIIKRERKNYYKMPLKICPSSDIMSTEG
jgi:hypothetical protein